MTLRPSDLPTILMPEGLPITADIRLGTIPGTYTSGHPTVIWDGETIASTRTYPIAKGLVLAPNDRVLGIIRGNTVVILCVLA